MRGCQGGSWRAPTPTGPQGRPAPWPLLAFLRVTPLTSASLRSIGKGALAGALFLLGRSGEPERVSHRRTRWCLEVPPRTLRGRLGRRCVKPRMPLELGSAAATAVGAAQTSESRCLIWHRSGRRAHR